MPLDSHIFSDEGVRWIRRILVIGCLSIAGIGFAYSSLELKTAESSLTARMTAESDVSLPAPSVLEASLLGFSGLAADLSWIQGLQYFGQQQQLSRQPVSLHDYADTIARLDPYFYEVYPWFSATYRGTHFPISSSDVATMNQFLDRGIRRFPDRWRLPYKAGMNYIGYPHGRSSQQRIREFSAAINYLEQASSLPGAPSSVPLTISWLYERRRGLQTRIDGETSGANSEDSRKVEYLTDVYFLIEDPSTRRQIRSMLEQSAQGRRALKQTIRTYRTSFRRHYRAQLSFLPPDLWAWSVADVELLHSDSHTN
jgi:hypothetical protein